jgi:hypothetical protein
MDDLTWRKSSFSSDHGDECVELAAVPAEMAWRKARRSDEKGGNCLELAAVPGAVAVRDSKHPEAGHLTLDRASLRKAVMAAARR